MSSHLDGDSIGESIYKVSGLIDLKRSTLVLPKHTILYFEKGARISNGRICGDFTEIKGYKYQILIMSKLMVHGILTL